MNLKFNNGDINWKKYGGTFVSKKLNNTDFDYYLFCNVTNLIEIGIEDEDKYSVDINIVSGSEISDEDKKECLYSLGLEKINLNKFTNFQMVGILNECGIGARVFITNGNNINKLLKEVRTQCNIIETTLGFYLDNKLNMLGDTGWDFLKNKIGVMK
jgi:hypothetical protein